LNRGCEVKRKTLNLVVSPVIERLVRAKTLEKVAGNREQVRKGRALAYRIGVADSIEQHIEPRD